MISSIVEKPFPLNQVSQLYAKRFSPETPPDDVKELAISAL